MGLFNFKKKKDNNILSGAGLVDFIKSNLEKPTEENTLKALKALATPANDLEHLTKEGELPWGWHSSTKEFTEKIQYGFLHFQQTWLESRNKSPKEFYWALKSLIVYLEDAERLCKKKGECYEFWFYEHLISRDFIEKRKAELKELTENLGNLTLNYEKRIANLSNIDAQIVEKLKENQNILQSDFVKLFDSTVQADVREKLYWMEKGGALERIKSGRSYLLKYKKVE